MSQPSRRVRLGFAIFALSLVSFGVVFSAAAPVMLIQSPKLGMPAMRMPGESFGISVLSTVAWMPTPTAALESDGISILLQVTSIQQAPVGLQTNVTCLAAIPADAPEGLYNLTVTLGGVTLVEPNAVQVVQAYKTSIRVAHIADPHIELGSAESITRLQTIVKEINLIHPDFVICTGDVAHMSLRAEWDIAYEIFLELQVPLFMVVGNHELGNVNVFIEQFAPLNYAFTYGPSFHFVAFNSGDKYTNPARAAPVWAFLDASLAGAQGAAHRVILTHIPPNDEDFSPPGQDFTTPFLALAKQHRAELVLVGHKHRDAVEEVNGVSIIQTAAYDHYRILDLNTSTGTWMSNWNPVGAGLHASIPAGNITCEEIANDGTHMSAKVKVTNDLGIPLPQCQFRFVVSASNTTQYAAHGATIVSTRKTGNRYLLDVAFNLPPRSTLEIRVEG